VLFHRLACLLILKISIVAQDATLVVTTRSGLPAEGQEFLTTQNPQEGSSENSRIVGLSIKTSKELDSEARDALRAKQFEAAAHSYKSVLKLDPHDSEAWNGLGIAQQQMGNLQESVSAFEQAVKYQPARSDYWLALGKAYIGTNDDEKAIKAFQEAVGLDPKSALGWYELGNAFNSPQQSERCYRQAITLEPDNPLFLFALGKLRPADDARIDALKSALQLNPNYSDAWYALAQAQESEAHYDQAIAALEALGSTLDKNAFVYYKSVTEADILLGVGDNYAHLNNFKPAERAYLTANETLKGRRALDYELMKHDEETSINVALSLATLYERWGKHKQSQKWMQYSSMLSQNRLKPPELER
jgi:tetratricopeptide (TPR) repeat protein